MAAQLSLYTDSRPTCSRHSKERPVCEPIELSFLSVKLAVDNLLFYFLGSSPNKKRSLGKLLKLYLFPNTKPLLVVLICKQNIADTSEVGND